MAWQVYVWSKHNPFIHMSFLGLFTFTAAYLPWVNVLLPCFLECQISLPDLKFELFLSDHIFMKPIIFLMLLCLNVPWHDKCAILLVAHPYMYAREMQYLVACFFFKKNILLYLEGPHDINLTFIIFRLHFSICYGQNICWSHLNLWCTNVFSSTWMLCFFCYEILTSVFHNTSN